MTESGPQTSAAAMWVLALLKRFHFRKTGNTVFQLSILNSHKHFINTMKENS